MKKKIKNEYYPMAATAATFAISSLSLGETLNKGQPPIAMSYDDKKVEIHTTSKSDVKSGLSTRKLLDYILLLWTNSQIGHPDDKVYFTLEDYMRIMGYKYNRQMRRECFTTICNDIATLGTIMLRQESGEWFGVVEDRCRFVSNTRTNHSQKDVVAGLACFEVSIQPGLLEHIKRDGNTMPFVSDVFRRSGRNANAYSIMKRMVWHFHTNSSSHKKRRLKVSTLLDCCPELTGKFLKSTRTTFNMALNLLATGNAGNGPLIRWGFELKNKHKRHTAAEISEMRLPHKDWLNATVAFKPIGMSSKMNFANPCKLNPASHAVLVDEDIADEYSDELDVLAFTSRTPVLSSPPDVAVYDRSSTEK